MKKTDTAIINRVLKLNMKGGPAGLNGSIKGKEHYYYMNSYMILASAEAAEGIEPASTTFNCDKMFEDAPELIDIQIDIEALQAFKKEGKKTGNGSKAPYIIKLNKGGRSIYLGANPSFLFDLLKFTGTDFIQIESTGLCGNFYKRPIYTTGAGRKGLLLPVNVNSVKSFTPEANQEADLVGVKPEAKKPEPVKADDPAYLMAVWYAENVILKQKTA